MNQKLDDLDDEKCTAKVKNALLRCKSVPLPGGHGSYFAELRHAHPSFRPGPDLAQRCFVCLALLGHEDEQENWNRKEWLPHALVWFDQNCPELTTALHRSWKKAVWPVAPFAPRVRASPRR